jgi:two-component system NarL family sensor kinase
VRRTPSLPRVALRGRGPALRAALRLAVASLALLALVAAIGAVALKHLATDEALTDARSVTVAFSRGVLRSAVTPGVLRGDPAAIDRLDRTVHDTVLGHPVVRVKVWALDGRIVYSDARPLIGRTFPLPEDLREALADGAVRAEVSDLSRPENRFERGRGRLVEVYLPLRLASGRRVMVETYRPASSIDGASHRIWRTFLPMLLALLAALAAVQLPLVWAQSRRERAEARERERFAREREQFARVAEESLRAERGRIAAELHEGVVQDLAGAAYAMHAAASLPAGASDADLRGALDRGAQVCRTTMTRMRELLVDLRRPARGVQDLEGALETLARPLRDAGIEVDVGIAVDRPVEDETALLLHRAAREILLDIRERANVTLVAIGLFGRDDALTLSVEHNVIGLDGATDERPNGRPRRLEAVSAQLAQRGGALSVDRAPGSGARFTATVPAS